MATLQLTILGIRITDMQLTTLGWSIQPHMQQGVLRNCAYACHKEMI